MNLINRLLIFSFLIFIASSCSTPKRSITSRGYKKEVKRKRLPSRDLSEIQLRDEVIIHAIQHVGRNYRYGGKKPSTGFDCSGLISYVYGKAGLNANGASHHQAEMGIWKSRTSLEPGDLIFFGKGKKVSHVAIVVKNERNRLEVIHSTSSRGVVLDEISDSKYWNARFLFGKDLISEEVKSYTSR